MTAASASPVTDPQAPSGSTAAPGIADKVRAQLLGDYPSSALSWIDGIRWTGPAQVPVSQVDRTAGTTDWSAAAKDRAKLALFQHKIAGGFRKPVVLIRRPGNPKLFAVDGHTRVLACMALGVPVAAWVGTAATAHGPWEVAHARQL